MHQKQPPPNVAFSVFFSLAALVAFLVLPWSLSSFFSASDPFFLSGPAVGFSSLLFAGAAGSLVCFGVCTIAASPRTTSIPRDATRRRRIIFGLLDGRAGSR